MPPTQSDEVGAWCGELPSLELPSPPGVTCLQKEKTVKRFCLDWFVFFLRRLSHSLSQSCETKFS